MSKVTNKRGVGVVLKRIGAAVFMAAMVVVLLLWLAGKFAPKVPQTVSTIATTAELPKTTAVRLEKIPIAETAVGTIRAVRETTIASKLLSRVTELNLRAGQHVKAGEVLLRLNDADLRARVQQAQAQVDSAQAQRDQLSLDESRLREVVKQNAASPQEYDRAKAALLSAEAQVTRAQEAVRETQADLDYATIRSPMDALIVDKRVDVGDTVTPGQVLLALYDPTQMQLIASVRESLTHRLSVGQQIGVRIEGLDKACSGTVSEIVPEAQSASRTFQVKVSGPCPEGVYPGMFGRIIIPLDDEQVLLIPRSAIRSVGQLELVDVVEAGQISRRAVRTGRAFGEDVEVLSGLHAGEQVAISPAASTASAQEGM